ncbi:hypothetical protein VTI74DRAFT_5202 [Chaetomium olivicolor]
MQALARCSRYPCLVLPMFNHRCVACRFAWSPACGAELKLLVNGCICRHGELQAAASSRTLLYSESLENPERPDGLTTVQD